MHLSLQSKVSLVTAQLHPGAGRAMLQAVFGQLELLALFLITLFEQGDLLETLFGLFAGLKCIGIMFDII